jgi:hypothetical protein
MKNIICSLLFTLLLGSGTSVWAALDADPLALSVVESFTAAIDAGSLEDAYWSASPLLQLSYGEQDWADDIFVLQQKLGRPLLRDLYRVREVETFRGMPDGRYLLIYYQTRTEFKSTAHEVVLLKQEEDLWEVCYYHLQ